jgi:dihydroorotate dehydrogenase
MHAQDDKPPADGPRASASSARSATRLFHWNLPHPILIASGPLTASLRTMEKMFQAGAAGVVTKTIAPTPDERRCRCQHFGDLLLNRDGYSQHSLEQWEADLSALRGRPIIANIVADTPEELASLARRVTAAGAEVLELGLSCPTLDQDPICCYPGKLQEYCVAVRRAVDVPLLVKLLLTTSATANRHMVSIVRDAGLDGVSFADTLPSLFIESSTGMPALGGPGGASGGFLKPLVLKALYDVANSGLVMVGIGGVMSAEDALDYVKMGCTAVQICTLVMNQSYRAIQPLVDRFEELLVDADSTTTRLTGASTMRLRTMVPKPEAVSL